MFNLTFATNKPIMSLPFHAYDLLKKALKIFIGAFIVVSAMSSCKNSTGNKAGTPPDSDTTKSSEAHTSLRENVLTSAEQKTLTPDGVIEDLKESNRHYVQNHLTANDYIGMMHRSANGQYPEAFILSCIDSRVPVEEVFD